MGRYVVQSLLDCGGGTLNCSGGSRAPSLIPHGRFSCNEEAKSGPDAKNQNGDFIGGV
jgi:hypothetical protein